MTAAVTARLVRLAARAVVDRQAGSVHTIERALDVSPFTARLLMDELEAGGIVGPHPPERLMRNVLLTPDQLTRERLDALTVTGADA